MAEYTKQMAEWAGLFGKEYTDRNAQTLADMELVYKTTYGVGRSQMNALFIGDLDRDIRILEIGSNVGVQLLFLQQIGFKNLYGIDIQSYAVEVSKSRTKGINIIQGSALDIPFKDSYFDLVFTSGVLIHIAPDNIDSVLDEIHRCTKQYIWGFEYYAETHTVIPYRGQKDILWKAHFSQLYLNRFSGLTLVKESLYKYKMENNQGRYVFT